MNRFFITLVIISSLCASFVSCSSDDAKVVDDVKYKDTIVVGVTPTLDCFPLFVAQETGISKSMGYFMWLHNYSAKADCDTALVGGSVCAAFTDYVRADNLKAHWAEMVKEKRGKKAKADSLSLFPHENMHLYFFTNFKARIKEAKQLTDKMVAVDRKSAEERMAQYVLDSVKLGPEKTFLVNILNLKVRERMLHNNTMDAVVLHEPAASVARKAGHKAVYSSGHHDSHPFGCMVATRNAQIVKDIYNAACDSINRKGIHAYDSVFVKRYGVPAQMVSAIPNHKFAKIR